MKDDMADLISDTIVAVAVLRVEHDKLIADIRKLVERMERNGYSGVETGRVTAKEVLDFWIPQFKMILEGRMSDG